ncbi:hypothetical protein K469DRAFT_712561 [Zopfia rhizophila CBS 207.26]|uniref:Uncharacterized protein n=1 Tax=Zopfia rhizophila CBS 207.26 TaxID=1314779 RepID=A0A6A6ER44_9PEZI|nr:hypothetical protein K469DRAFT_712561 [Zopfia rhizophila CBS 207.26]
MAQQRPALRDIAPNQLVAVRTERTKLATKPRRGPKPRDPRVQRSGSYSPPPIVHGASRKSYTREQKLKVIDYMTNERVFDDSWRLTGQRTRCRRGQKWFDEYHRPPTNRETALHFNRSERTIESWWREAPRIRQMKKGTQQDHLMV